MAVYFATQQQKKPQRANSAVTAQNIYTSITGAPKALNNATASTGWSYQDYVAPTYTPSADVLQRQQQFQTHEQNKPGEYKSQYQDKMNDLYNQYSNRGPFQYDLNADALYQQVADRYINQGQMAMMDTMGQAAALTGGYGNSYAQNVGQQAYQEYLKGLYDQVPTYYNMALNQYNAEGDRMLTQYNLLSGMEDQAYGRYMDNMNMYYNELNRLQGAYESERNFDRGNFDTDRSFGYGVYSNDRDLAYQDYRNGIADQQWNMQWQHQLEQDALAQKNWEKQFKEDKRRWDASQASSGGGGGGGGGGGSSESGKDNDKDETPSKPPSSLWGASPATALEAKNRGDVSLSEYNDYIRRLYGGG